MTAKTENTNPVEPGYDINSIMERIPHRYPFLLVDRVLDWRLNDYLVAIKNVSMNEPFFPGHFPRNPVMPGVLIMEALAQASALLWVQESHPDALFYFVGMENVRFKKPVVPGDQLRLETRLKRVIRGFAKFDVQALVDGEVVAEAELMCAYRANV
ncbi:MAG: 3-hydroxyacyl-ACP dehydratase FabZ [Formosimonas sp.]|jgi:3-hydroxyacyl-[acyl-carrier-protein] dehydratase